MKGKNTSKKSQINFQLPVLQISYYKVGASVGDISFPVTSMIPDSSCDLQVVDTKLLMHSAQCIFSFCARIVAAVSHIITFKGAWSVYIYKKTAESI